MFPGPGLEPMFDRTAARSDPHHWTDASSRGLVVSAHYLATAAGVRMLELGGNAFDAAIATSLALGVVEPAGSGLGGSAIALMHRARDGTNSVLAAPCIAPRAAAPERVAQASRYRGHAAVAVPTHPAALELLHQRYASLELRQLFEPAITLAREGFDVSPVLARLIEEYRTPLGNGAAAETFLPNGDPLMPGRRLRQPPLAATLTRLSEIGFRDFYQGEIAARMIMDVRRGGGFLERDDLEAVAPRILAPIQGEFAGCRVLTVGPPAGGPTLLQMLQMIAALPELPDLDRPDGAVTLARIIRRARTDRRRFRLKVGTWELDGAAELATPEYARRALAEIGLGETTHLCTADEEGNVVSMTQSIERSFGAATMSLDLGFLYNGFLRGFKVKSRRHPHYLRPGAAARSNSSPTILLDEGRPVAAVGCTGSERSASSIAQVLTRLQRGQDAFSAVHAPRLHATPDGLVLLEPRFDDQVPTALRAEGLELEILDDYSFRMGGLQLLVRQEAGWFGVGEPRRDSAAAGPRTSGSGSPVSREAAP